MPATGPCRTQEVEDMQDMRAAGGAGLAKCLAVFTAFALSACDLNPRPEDPGADQTVSPGPGNFGTGGGATSGAAGAPGMEPTFGGSAGNGSTAGPPRGERVDGGGARDAGSDAGEPDGGADAAR
jgi:hypothetical protein